MIKLTGELKSYNKELSSNRFKDVEIHGLDDNNKLLFMNALDLENRKNKSKLRDLLGGIKTYGIIEYEADKMDYYHWDNITESIPTRINSSCGYDFYLPERLFYDSLQSFKTYHYAVESNLINKDEALKLLLTQFNYMPRISKLRDLPKWSRLLRMLFDDCIEVFKLTGNYESIYAKLSDMLVRKPKKYILELSTDCRDMITSSVSENFTSCFDVKKGGCNMCSTNYLAIDNNTMVLKIYSCDEDNLNAMKNGIMPYDRAVARRYISVDTDNNLESLVIGRAYPDDNILEENEVAKIIALNILGWSEDSKVTHSTRCEVEYGNNYSGYADYNQSKTHFYTNGKYFRIKVGNKGAIIYNPLTDNYETNTTYKLINNTMCLLYEKDYLKMQDSCIPTISREPTLCTRTITSDYISAMVDDIVQNETTFIDIFGILRDRNMLVDAEEEIEPFE